MAFKAELSIGNNTYRVFHCHYAFNQHIDSSGHPSSAVKGGTIEFEVESSEDLFLVTWMLQPDQVEDGSIVYYEKDGIQAMKTIAFTKAYMVSYSENFSNFGENPIMQRITISAMEIQITAGNQVATQTNEWPA